MDADLRRSQAGTVGRAHGFKHVGQELVEKTGVEIGNGLAHLEQARVPHAQDGADHTCPRTANSSTRTARTMLWPSTASSCDSSTRVLLSPRPAAWLTTTLRVA